MGINITYTIDPKLYPAFAALGFTSALFDQSIAEGMAYFTHIWNNIVSRVTKNGRVAFLLMQPKKGSVEETYWGWTKGKNCWINPYPRSPSTGLISKWSVSGIRHIAHHEGGHALVYNRHWKLANYYGDARFSHVLSLKGRDFFGAFSPYEHWHRRSWGVKTKEAWHPYVRTWLLMSTTDRILNRDLLMKVIKPYYQLGRNKNQILHSLIGVRDIDDELRLLPFLKKPII